VREFRLAVRGDRLWHVRVAANDQRLVPRGARLSFGHANRHDTLVVRSADHEADIVVLGEVIRRPFFARTRYDIGAEIIERGLKRADPDGDDRVVLRCPAAAGGADPRRLFGVTRPRPFVGADRRHRAVGRRPRSHHSQKRLAHDLPAALC
jgi:hypothetical protein